jgi:hypothetical protein
MIARFWTLLGTGFEALPFRSEDFSNDLEVALALGVGYLQPEFAHYVFYEIASYPCWLVNFSAFRTRLLCVHLFIGFSDLLCTLLTETQIPKYPNHVLIPGICYRLEDVSCFFSYALSLVLETTVPTKDCSFRWRWRWVRMIFSLLCAIDAFLHVELFTLAGSPNGYI